MIQSTRKFTLGAVISFALAVLPATRLLSQKLADPTAVKNVVLVHGAFADGTCWSKVISLLEAKGYHAVAVQNPLTSLADDVAATKRAIALQDGPVILVGHSWGGAVITQAGDGPKVAALVHVSAYAPPTQVSPLTMRVVRTVGLRDRSRSVWTTRSSLT